MRACVWILLSLLLISPVGSQAPETIRRVEAPTSIDGPAAFVVREQQIFAYAAQIARGVAGAERGESVESALTRLFALLAAVDTQVVVEFSPDGGTWHNAPALTTDAYFRFRVGNSATPTAAIPTRGPPGQPTQIQWRAEGESVWGDYADGDSLIRFSVDGGTTWVPPTGINLKGPQGEPGAPSGVNTDITEARFRFTADTTNQTVTSTRATLADRWVRGYANITSFTGGLAGIATFGTEGITLPSAGVYSFVMQIDIELRGADRGVVPSEWGLTLHIENADGSLIDEFIFFDDMIEDRFTTNETFRAYSSIPPLSLPAGTQVQLRLFYRRIFAGGGTSDVLQFRVVTPAEDDDRVVIRRYTQAGNPSGTKGDSQRAIFLRSQTRPAVPTGIGLNGTIFTNLGNWEQSGPAAGSQPIWIQWLEIDNDTTPATVHTVGNPFPLPAGPAGTAGPRGLSEISVWTRNATRPAVPTALVFRQDTTLSIASAGGLTWHRDPYNAQGSTKLWKQLVSLDTATSPPGETWQGSPIPEGLPGPKGDSIRSIWEHAGTAPATPTGISITAAGVWDDLNASDGTVWRATPGSPPGGESIWQQDFLVDWEPHPPSLTPLGSPFPSSLRGIQGIAGPAGAGGRGVRLYYMRTTTSTRPNRPTILYTNGVFTEPVPDTWVPLIPNTGGDYLWRLAVYYQQDVNGQTVGNPVQFNATNGISFIEIYQRGATAPAAPVLTYDGTTIGGLGTWARAIPATPTTQNLWAMTATYREGSSTITLDPVIYLKGLAESAPVAPPATASYVFRYGLATASNAPTGTAVTLPTVQLASGQSHTYAAVTMPITTAVGVNYYVQLPNGASMTSARDSFQGETIQDWTRTGQRWFYAIGYANSQETIVFTIRRD